MLMDTAFWKKGGDRGFWSKERNDLKDDPGGNRSISRTDCCNK